MVSFPTSFGFFEWEQDDQVLSFQVVFENTPYYLKKIFKFRKAVD